MLTANYTVASVVHKWYPQHPRLLFSTGEKYVLTWPCGNHEHPLHATRNYIKENYVQYNELPYRDISTELAASLELALNAKDNDEAVTILLEHRQEIVTLCANAPKNTLLPQNY